MIIDSNGKGVFYPITTLVDLDDRIKQFKQTGIFNELTRNRIIKYAVNQYKSRNISEEQFTTFKTFFEIAFKDNTYRLSNFYRRICKYLK